MAGVASETLDVLSLASRRARATSIGARHSRKRNGTLCRLASSRERSVSAMRALLYTTPKAMLDASSVLTNAFLILLTVVFILLEVENLPGKLRIATDNPEITLSAVEKFSQSAQSYMFIKTVISAARIKNGSLTKEASKA